MEITTGDRLHFGAFALGLEYTVRFGLKLTDEVNGEMLQQAVKKTQLRYPYLSVTLHKNENDYYYEDNPRPVVLHHTDERTSLNTEESNYHIWSVSYNEDRIYLDISHLITDGTAMYMVLATLLYYYCSQRYGVTDHTGIRTLEDPILPEETVDPFENAPMLDLSKMLMPGTVPAFSLTDDGGMTVCEPLVWDIAIPEKDFVKFSFENNASPGSMVCVLMARAVDKLFPERTKDLTNSYIINAVSESSDQQASQPEKVTSIENWTEDSPAMKSIMAFVDEVTDEKSDKFVPAEKRIAVFDSDGTLYGELFPTYVDQCLMIYRLTKDEAYKGNEEDVAYCKALEEYLINGGEKPKAPRSSGDIIADAFKGMTVEDYRAYVRKFMAEPVVGFENMTYADGYYKPMVSLIKYLTENGFKVYINSGVEVNMLRELSMDTLGQYIPSYQILGTEFGITSEGRPDDVKARDYTPAADEKIVFDGTVSFKNLKLNKVVSIVNDLGISPILAFGNSSGDLAMGQYVMQHGGKAYMLLCDDTDRDHGDLDTAASFKADCDKMGIETVSMKNEFATIYGDFKLTPYTASQAEESLAPAA